MHTHVHACAHIYTCRHTHTHFTKPLKATCGSLPGPAKLMTSRCCHWWASQHVVVYPISAPTHCSDPYTSPLPPSCQTRFRTWLLSFGRLSLLHGGHYMARWATLGFDGQAHHTGSWKDSEWKCVCWDKTLTCLCIRPHGQSDDGNVNWGNLATNAL